MSTTTPPAKRLRIPRPIPIREAEAYAKKPLPRRWINFLAKQELRTIEGRPHVNLPFGVLMEYHHNIAPLLIHARALSRSDIKAVLGEIVTNSAHAWRYLADLTYAMGHEFLPEAREALASMVLERAGPQNIKIWSFNQTPLLAAMAASGILDPQQDLKWVVSMALKGSNTDLLAACLTSPNLPAEQVERIADALARYEKGDYSVIGGPDVRSLHAFLGVHEGRRHHLATAATATMGRGEEWASLPYTMATRPEVALDPANSGLLVASAQRMAAKGNAYAKHPEDAITCWTNFLFRRLTPADLPRFLALWAFTTPEGFSLPGEALGGLLDQIDNGQIATLNHDLLLSLASSKSAGTREAGRLLFASQRQILNGPQRRPAVTRKSTTRA